MKKAHFYLAFLFTPLFCGAQIQIGDDVDGAIGGDKLGTSVSISANGKVFASGAKLNDAGGPGAGHVRIYELSDSDNWEQIGMDIIGDAGGDNSGSAVSLSSDGTIVAIGSPFSNVTYTEAGQVRVFQLNESDDWVQLGDDIYGFFVDNHLGGSLSLSADGTILAIGTYNGDGVIVFELIADEWVQLGETFEPEAFDDYLGISLSLSDDGHTLALGGPLNNGDGPPGTFSGHVRVFKLNDSDDWIQIGADIDGVAGDLLGESVTISGDGTIVAAGGTGSDDNTGHVTIYQLDDSDNWVQLGDDINGETLDDRSGFAVTLSENGTILAISAPRNDNAGDLSGHVRVYQLNAMDEEWEQIGMDIEGEAMTDLSGSAISISDNGTTLAIGADANDGAGPGGNAGHVRVFDLSDIVVDLSSVEEDILENSVTLYPNPALNQVSIKTTLIISNVSIYNLQGKLIQTSTNNTIDITAIKFGVYIIKITTEKGSISKQLIKS